VLFAPEGWKSVSAKAGTGLEELLSQIARHARDSLGDGTDALLARQRHRDGARNALDSLRRALEGGKPLELVADDLRSAGRALDRIVGAIDVEDVLDVIFSRFCIGK
jgi:tRNA modification GTPase